jgi:hypothetical protein
MKTRNLKLVCLLLETVGIVALFLPFYSGVSPWNVLASAIGFVSSLDRGLWVFALPALVAPLVWLQTLHSAFRESLPRWELRLCVLLAALLAFVPAGWCLCAWLSSLVSEVDELEKWILTIITLSLLGLSLAAVGFLVTLKRKGVVFQFLAPLVLRCAYLPNAVTCLVFFVCWGRIAWPFESESRRPLQVGAACVAATVLLYLAEIVYLTRQGVKTRPGPAATQAR